MDTFKYLMTVFWFILVSAPHTPDINNQPNQSQSIRIYCFFVHYVHFTEVKGENFRSTVGRKHVELMRKSSYLFKKKKNLKQK